MATTSLTIDVSELEKLKNYILSRNLKREHPTNEYELLRVKDGDISIIVYKSGKVVHNGSKPSLEVLDIILGKEEKFDYILGSDETGKGEWYGPLVVVATALTPSEIIELRKLGARDSKTIIKRKLMELADQIINMRFVRQSSILLPETYNDLYAKFQKEGKSLNDLMAWAHSAVIKDILSKIKYKRAKVVIDKFDFEKTEFRLKPVDKTNLEIIQDPKGEFETSVATASIIAKYLFEKEVDRLNQRYGIDLRSSEPRDIDAKVLPCVAKLHFRNVRKRVELPR